MSNNFETPEVDAEIIASKEDYYSGEFNTFSDWKGNTYFREDGYTFQILRTDPSLDEGQIYIVSSSGYYPNTSVRLDLLDAKLPVGSRGNREDKEINLFSKIRRVLPPWKT